MTLKNLCAALAVMIFIFIPNAEAKIVTDKLPLLTYAETSVAIYDAPGGTKQGTIPIGNSLVLVKIIRPDGWSYGSYKIPNSKKRAYGWFIMNELQGYADFENYTEKTSYDIDAYRTRSSNMLVGKVSSDEDIVVVAKRGDRIKVIFKADGNYYRMGWIDKSSLQGGSSSLNENILNGSSADILSSGNEDFSEIEGSFDDEEFYSEGDE